VLVKVEKFAMSMKNHRSVVAILTVTLLLSAAASAQEINGVPGSPSATTTIPGDQLPAPSQNFGGTIEREATKSKPYWPARIVPPKGAPNVLLIITDDSGYGVPSTFGGVIPTPALDRIARDGLRYTNFHSTALCSPTRAALITGRNHHSVGYGVVAEQATGYPGYDSIITKDKATIGRILQDNGIKEVGRRLGVRYVLEGSVRKASGKVRITGQLIDAVTGAHIWADRFERDLTDVFALQDEVTVAVVSAIQPKLFQTELALATRRRPENLTAYDFYLRAMQQYYLATREGLTETIRLAHRALELDPRFGLVAALASVSHANNVVFDFANDPQFERAEAVRLARLVLSADDSDPEALAIAAVTLAFMVGDCESSVELADRAVVLNPNSYWAWASRGWVYRVAGLPEEAIQSFERSFRMSPVDPLLHRSFVGMGMALVELRRFDEAIGAGKKAQRQNPDYSGAYRCLASAFAHLGRDAEAREAAALVLGEW
jgi:tetratricopeptide (TPR) repeat protein